MLRVDLTPLSVMFEANETSGPQRDPDAVMFTGPILTSDFKLVAGTIRITLTVTVDIDNPGLLRQLRGGKNVITTRDIAIAIRDEFQTRAIQPVIGRASSSELNGAPEIFQALGDTARRELKSQLTGYGLLTRNFAPSLLPVEVISTAEQQQVRPPQTSC